MAEILFNVGREYEWPDSEGRILIPDEGQLPQIPYSLEGIPGRNILTSTTARQPEKNAPRFDAVSSASTNLVWMREREQWVAFKESWTYGRKDNYGFSDDDLFLEGPWSLDVSCKLVIIRAYGKSLSPEYDVSLVDEIAPFIWECIDLSAEDILQQERDQREKALKTPAEVVYQMMQASMYHVGSDEEFRLRGLVRVLARINRYGDDQSIQLSGCRREGEHHGGYDYTVVSRDDLGRGRLLYRGKMTDGDIAIEIWQSKIQDSQKALILAIRETKETGYVGIDNHYGTDYWWNVVGMRVF